MRPKWIFDDETISLRPAWKSLTRLGQGRLHLLKTGGCGLSNGRSFPKSGRTTWQLLVCSHLNNSCQTPRRQLVCTIPSLPSQPQASASDWSWLRRLRVPCKEAAHFWPRLDLLFRAFLHPLGSAARFGLSVRPCATTGVGMGRDWQLPEPHTTVPFGSTSPMWVFVCGSSLSWVKPFMPCRWTQATWPWRPS